MILLINIYYCSLLVSLSSLQLYNEEIIDLFDPDRDQVKHLHMHKTMKVLYT